MLSAANTARVARTAQAAFCRGLAAKALSARVASEATGGHLTFSSAQSVSCHHFLIKFPDSSIR